jgi:hypothetical protein
VFSGNGGIEIVRYYSAFKKQEKTICIKGYEDGIGKTIQVLKAIELLALDTDFDFLIFSADEAVEQFVVNSEYFKLKRWK